MKNSKEVVFKGAATALVTPFDRNGYVNYRELDKLIEFQIGNSIDAIVLLGTTGEAPSLIGEEREKLLQFAIKRIANRVPVIVGTGGCNMNEAIAKTKMAENLGADAALVVTPYYLKTTQEGLYKYYRSIAETTSLPVIIYNVPGRTGVNILPETVVKLAHDCENIVGIKEASGNLEQVAKLFENIPDGFMVYSGNDDQTADIYHLGGHGVISVLSNAFPLDVAKMCSDLELGYSSGDKIQKKFEGFNELLFVEPNPIPIKGFMNHLGIDCGSPRLPLVPCTEELEKQLVAEYQKLYDELQTDFSVCKKLNII